jgi:transcriptional repressor NrdR
MKCPFCGAPESRVIDSRGLEEEVRRRRACSTCGARFTTSERVQNHALFVVKKDGRRESYDREKLAAGIRKACEKRPLPTGSVEKLITGVEERLHELGRAEILSTTIGDMVMEELEQLDHIAYIRFASVYREFADIGALKEALDSLSTTPKGRNSLTSGPNSPVQSS